MNVMEIITKTKSHVHVQPK